MKTTGEVLALGTNFPSFPPQAMMSGRVWGSLRADSVFEMPDRGLWAEVSARPTSIFGIAFELLRRFEEVEANAEASMHRAPFFLRQMKDEVDAEATWPRPAGQLDSLNGPRGWDGRPRQSQACR
jgi:hypothetical protein